jgi:hypothetical protein
MRVGNEAQSSDGYKCSDFWCSMEGHSFDEKFLSCALAANVKVLVSGDRHLLDLKQYKSVRIVTAREFYEENIHKIT